MAGLADRYGVHARTLGKWIEAAGAHYPELPRKGKKVPKAVPGPGATISLAEPAAVEAGATPAPAVRGPDAPLEPHVEVGTVAEEHPPTRKQAAAGLQLP